MDFRALKDDMGKKQMTLKQAADFLKTANLPFSVVTMRKAIRDGKLKATLNTSAPVTYYVIEENDLIKWAMTPKHHKPGRKTE